MQQTKTKTSAEFETRLFADLSNGTNRALSSLVSVQLGRISIESIKGRSSMAIQLMGEKSLVKSYIKMHSEKKNVCENKEKWHTLSPGLTTRKVMQLCNSLLLAKAGQMHRAVNQLRINTKISKINIL